MEIAGQRADLTSVQDREVSELLWENGRVFAQRLTRKTQNSPSFANVHLMKKRFGTVDSLHDRKDDNLHLNLPRNNSLQDNKHRDSWYQTHVNMFLENDEDNSCDKNLLDPQIVPENEYENLVISNRSLVSVEEEQDLESERKIKRVNKSVPDDQSEAVCRDGEFTEKKKLMNAEKSMEPRPVASSSCCSRGASNNPIYNNLMRRYHEDTEGSADLSDEEKLENAREQVPARGGGGTRRKRAAEVHNQSERMRRDKINKKMRALQELIPNCNKVDKASMLDEAIEYLKTLQLQVQMMSMGSGVCMPQMMMIATGMQQIHALQMAHFSAMGMRMNMGGVGCTPPTQFFIPPIAAATAVPGFAAQPLSPMSLFGAPPVGLFHKPVPVAGGSQNSTPVELMASAKLSNPKDPNHLKEMNDAKPECSKTQPCI